MADLGRIDVGALGGWAGSPFLVPVIEHRPRGLMFHKRHLFRRETAPAFIVPDWDIRAGFSPRRHWWSRRRAVDASAGRLMRISVKS